MSDRPCSYTPDGPESYDLHLSSCRECSEQERLLRDAEQSLREEAGPVSSALGRDLASRLPVAPWEGAVHKNWVAALIMGAVLLLALATLGVLGGTGAFEPLANAIRQTTRSISELPDIASSLGSLMQSAPAGFRALVITAFVIINAIFALLLRRRPRGVRG